VKSERMGRGGVHPEGGIHLEARGMTRTEQQRWVTCASCYSIERAGRVRGWKGEVVETLVRILPQPTMTVIDNLVADNVPTALFNLTALRYQQ
jgi:hypothetical protein